MTNVTETAQSIEDAELDAILSGDSLFDADEGENEIVAAEAVKDSESGISESVADDVVTELELETVRGEAYEDQDKNAAAEDVIATEDPKKKAKAKRVSTAGMKPSEVIMTKCGEKIYELAIIKSSMATLSDKKLKAEVDAYLTSVDSLPKKVAEKVVNVFHHMNSGVNLSTFTRRAIDLLVEKGEMSATDLKNNYLSRPYGAGTSSAQSSQMMKVLPSIGAAERRGNTLSLIEDSPILAMITALATSTPEPSED